MLRACCESTALRSGVFSNEKTRNFFVAENMRMFKISRRTCGGVLGVVAPPLGEGVAEKATKRRDLPLERGEVFPLPKKIAIDLCRNCGRRLFLRKLAYALRFFTSLKKRIFKLPRNFNF